MKNTVENRNVSTIFFNNIHFYKIQKLHFFDVKVCFLIGFG